MSNPLIEKALAVAREAHHGQIYGDQPYITHCIAVMECVRQSSSEQIDQVIALIHDVVEDSPITLQEIEAMFDKEVAEAIDALTKRTSDGTYPQYILRLSQNGRARRVKICDLMVNLENIRRNKRKLRNMMKYEIALDYLLSVESSQKSCGGINVKIEHVDQGIKVFDAGQERQFPWKQLASIWATMPTAQAGIVALANVLAPTATNAYIEAHASSYTADSLSLALFGLPAFYFIDFLKLQPKEV